MTIRRLFLFTSIIIIYFSVGNKLAFGQQFIFFPIDNKGQVLVQQIGNIVELTGTWNNSKPPNWKDLIDYTRLTCATFTLVEQWDCGNPSRHSTISLYFYFKFVVGFSPKCNQEICVWARGHSEYGQVCVNNKAQGYSVSAKLLDRCNNEIHARGLPNPNFVDIDERIIPWAELRSRVRTQFPPSVTGHFHVGGQDLWMVTMTYLEGDSLHAIYKGSNWNIWQWFDSDTLGNGKNIEFCVPYGHFTSYSVFVGRVKFTIEDVAFQDTLAINNEGDRYGHYAACFPESSIMKFGTTVSIPSAYVNWPPECEPPEPVCEVKAYNHNNDSLLVTTITSGITQTQFSTEFWESDYRIHGFQDLQIPIDWKAEVSLHATSERVVGPTDPLMTFRIFHAFKASDIIYNPPHDAIVSPGDTLFSFADPLPLLLENPRIKYRWYVLPSDAGHFRWGTGTALTSLYNPFIVDRSVNFQLFYTVEDIATGYKDTCDIDPIFGIPPGITITAPDSAHRKVTFDSSQTGILTIAAAGTTDPFTCYEDSLVWSITPILGTACTLLVSPTNAKGRNVTFSFRHLPESNSQFGNKYIKASLPRFNKAESVLVKVFFDKYAYNNPSDTLPNWYYYWGQTPAYCGPSIFGGDSCIINRIGYYKWGLYLYNVCPAAAETSYIACSGLNNDGIDLFASNCRHEYTHLTYYNSIWRPLGGYIRAFDSDSDRVLNTVEPQLGLDSTLQDSDGDGDIDWEDLGYHNECLWHKSDADLFDWSNPGHQY